MGPQTPAVPVQNWVQKSNWQSCWLHVQTPCLIRDRTQHKGIQSSRRVRQFHGTAGNTKGYDTRRDKNRDKKDAVLRQVCSHIRNNTWHKNARDLLFTDTLKHYRNVSSELTVSSNDDLILRGSRIVVPSTLEQRVLQLAHESHQGVANTKSLLREKVWFPNIDRKVEAHDHELHCLTGKYPRHPCWAASNVWIARSTMAQSECRFLWTITNWGVSAGHYRWLHTVSCS